MLQVGDEADGVPAQGRTWWGAPRVGIESSGGGASRALSWFIAGVGTIGFLLFFIYGFLLFFEPYEFLLYNSRASTKASAVSRKGVPEKK
jgi:hypothetical protein